MVWNPQQYLKFSGHRLRPAVDLLMRIPDFPVRSVADLGAGAGNVTKLIKERWPDAVVIGVEGSAEMGAAVRKHRSLGDGISAGSGRRESGQGMDQGHLVDPISGRA